MSDEMKKAANEEPEVEAHKRAANDEPDGQDENEVEAHKLAGSPKVAVRSDVKSA